MSGHTKGPWVINGLVIETASGKEICLMGEPAQFAGDTPDMCPNYEENAPLIAAAPDLLEACAGASIMLSSVLKEYDDEPWAQRVRAAIAKAQGEQS